MTLSGYKSAHQATMANTKVERMFNLDPHLYENDMTVIKGILSQVIPDYIRQTNTLWTNLYTRAFQKTLYSFICKCKLGVVVYTSYGGNLLSFFTGWCN